MHTILGEGLDARAFTDLSTLTPGTLITSNEQFFVRTTCPPRARETGSWSIAITGSASGPRAIAIADLHARAAPMGTHLIECAGNARGGRFGLISVARWSGVRLADLIDLTASSREPSHVLIAGVDHDAPSVTSAAGASWIFTRQQLLGAGAFLATGMNGVPLPPDHGAPVRLIVPGWYGCACIKWVNAIAFVDDRAAATGQMKEFALRTHQMGVPAHAREYAPATIDLAAMPVRVEKWRLPANGGVAYRIVGIAWGGDAHTPPLSIRCRPNDPFVSVNGCPPLPSEALKDNWALWTHLWRPTESGRYQIVVRADDPKIRTRRLDLYFYTRTVRIDDI